MSEAQAELKCNVSEAQAELIHFQCFYIIYIIYTLSMFLYYILYIHFQCFLYQFHIVLY